ncbi:MAG: hypothetical protein ACI94Y_002993 [Maribacter sp.]|jgi:hypothetical protein
MFLGIAVYAQINVTAALDSNSILIGDQIQLNFRIKQAPNAEYLSADFNASLDSIKQIELIEVKDPINNEDGSISQSILITSFEDGTHLILGIIFSSKINGRIQKNLSNTVYLRVDPIAIDTTVVDLRPIKDIMEEPVRLSDWIHYILIPLGIVLALILLFFVVRKLTKKEVEAPIIEQIFHIPPHITALEKLKELKKKELWQKGAVKEYYSEISYIAREYLENRYKINALESVTDEIIPELKTKDIPEALQQRLINTLRTSDMVKFAKVKPGIETHESVIKQVEQLVQETQQIIIPSTEEEENV